MSLNIVMDRFGFPIEVIEQVKQYISVTESVLAKTGLLDSFWSAYDHHPITLERKEVHDFAHRINDLELQLKGAIQKVGDTGEVILLIEGIMSPVNNSTVLYRMKKDGSLFFRERVVNRPYSYYMNFIYALDKLGVSTYWTANPKGTAVALVSFVKESNKPEFTTFKRYIKQKPSIPQLNPQVERLMSLSHGLGVTRAQALIAQFGTVWNTINADESELIKVDGVGVKTARDLLEGIGRKMWDIS